MNRKKIDKALSDLERLLEATTYAFTAAQNEDNPAIKQALTDSCEQQVREDVEEIKNRLTPNEFTQLQTEFVASLDDEEKLLWEKIKSIKP